MTLPRAKIHQFGAPQNLLRKPLEMPQNRLKKPSISSGFFLWFDGSKLKARSCTLPWVVARGNLLKTPPFWSLIFSKKGGFHQISSPATTKQDFRYRPWGDRLKSLGLRAMSCFTTISLRWLITRSCALSSRENPIQPTPIP